jgi:hypothetical protein
MGDPKPLASLTSGLLARKGQAAPAMRRQNMMLSAVEPVASHNNGALEDLGWNDMGEPSEPVRQSTGLSPMAPSAPAPELSNPVPITPDVEIEESETPVVVLQHEELARDFAPPAPVVEEEEVVEPVEPVAPVVSVVPVIEAAKPRVAAVRAAPGSRGKAAFTLRLDGERHLKLRLVCAVNHRSAQQIVTQALDEFLQRQPSAAELFAGGSPAN